MKLWYEALFENYGQKYDRENFAQGTLKECDFTNAIIRGSVFYRLKTGSKNLKIKWDLTSCVFEKADLSETIYIRCDLGSVSFFESILKNAVFEACHLTKTSFLGADIGGTSFENSKIDKTYLDMNGFVHFGQARGFVLE